MFDIKDRYEISWFCRRFCGLLVDFPKNLNPTILKSDTLCSQYDAEEACSALKSAHDFLTGITRELLPIPVLEDNTQNILEKVFSKIDLMWALCLLGKLHDENNEYCFYFEKSSLKVNKRTLPESYSAAFRNISDSGCYVEFFKCDKPVKDYKSCDNGILHFDNRLTALGLYLFIQKVTQKRWYSEDDRAGRYTKGNCIPIVHCVEPYYRVDMRIFTCSDRLKYNIFEQMAGYSDEFIGYFKRIYDFVIENYPDCMPNRGIYRYIGCSITFGVDANHRMIGQLGVGHNEHEFGFYGALTGKEVKMALDEIDFFSEKVTKQFLHDTACTCDLCKRKVGVINYRGKLYNNLYKGYENRFNIESGDDVQQVIKILDIKAKCNMNTRAK